MRILLTTLNAKYIHINLAIRLLYELNQDHEGLEWKEFTIKEDKDDIAAHCAQFDLVAFSCYIWNITQTLEVCAKIKAINPNCKILLGGPEVSYEWEDVINLPQIDYIITGEGEVPFQTFIQNYPNLEMVPSLVRKEGGEVHYNPEVVGFDLKNYEGLMPYKFDPPETLMNRVLYIETSRGCPYKCEFCLASLDNKVRYLPDSTIKNMLLYLMEHGKVVKFLDRTFNIKKDFTLDLFQFILDNHRPGNVFQFEITADIIHPDIIAFIQEKVPPGLFRFEIGIQTVNQKANLEVNRKQNFDKTSAIIKKLDNKIEMHLDLIVGLALDYYEDIRYSFEEVFKLFPPELQLGFLKFLKGTPVREKFEQYGFEFDPNPPYQIIRSNFLSEEELFKITQLEHALEIYWNKKRAENVLRYVTQTYNIFDFMQGLGAYFGTKNEYHKYTLPDVYQNLLGYIEQAFPEDQVLRQMAYIDYYLYSKVRPKPLEGAELEKGANIRLVEFLHLDKSNYRFITLPISFVFEEWSKNALIVAEEQHLIVRYSGREKAIVFDSMPQVELG